MLLGPGLLIGGSYTPATFVSYATADNVDAVTNMAKPASLAIGDVVLALSLEAASASNDGVPLDGGGSGGAWSNLGRLAWTAFGYGAQIAWKVATAADLINNWRPDGLGYFCNNGRVTTLAFRGASSVTKRSTGNNASGLSSLTLAGFEKSPNSKLLLACISDRDTDATLTLPTGFTGRVDETAGGIWREEIATLAPGDYVDGTSVTWTDTDGTNTYGEIGFLLELT